MSQRFSIVVPVKDEVDFLFPNLISLCKLNPSEIIVCTDAPTPKNIAYLLKIFSHKFDKGKIIRVLPVSRNKEYLFHHAWVRRCGFRAAKNDIILTSDVDLVVSKIVLKGFRLIGKNNVGMVTFAKLRVTERSLSSFARLITITLMRLLHISLFRHVYEGKILSGFTGLYWLYRPYWIDTKGESIKSLPSPTFKVLPPLKEVIHTLGEDDHLKNQMIKKHKVVYIARIGATVQSDERPHEKVRQIMNGRFDARKGRSMFGVLVHALFYIEPSYFRTYLAEKKRIQAMRQNNPSP